MMTTADRTVDGAAKPKRLTLSEIVEQLLARGGGEHSSVTLTRNAKGATQIEVVVRTGETSEIATADAAAAKATELYDTLRAKYPTASGNVGAEREPLTSPVPPRE